MFKVFALLTAFFGQVSALSDIYVCSSADETFLGKYIAGNAIDGATSFVNENNMAFFRHSGFWYLGDTTQWPPVTHYRCVDFEGCNSGEEFPADNSEGKWTINKRFGKEPIPAISFSPCDNSDELTNEKFITHRVEDFASTDDVHEPSAVADFNSSLRRDIHLTAAATKVPKSYTCRVLPGRVPDESCTVDPKPIRVHPQDTVDFMFQKQNENRATFRKERERAQEKATNRKLTTYEPPSSMYTPPVQFYNKNRPYFQEYIKYRSELTPVVMPIFTLTKGSIRDRAVSSFMPKDDPNKVSKREAQFAQRVTKVREEEKESEKVKGMIRTKKHRKRQEDLAKQQQWREQQWGALASPVKPVRPATGGHGLRPQEGSPRHCTDSRPGTCNSFSPAALKTASRDRPDYPTAGTIWLTNV